MLRPLLLLPVALCHLPPSLVKAFPPLLCFAFDTALAPCLSLTAPAAVTAKTRCRCWCLSWDGEEGSGELGAAGST